VNNINHLGVLTGVDISKAWMVRILETKWLARKIYVGWRKRGLLQPMYLRSMDLMLLRAT
jgi:hypothetical protein